MCIRDRAITKHDKPHAASPLSTHLHVASPFAGHGCQPAELQAWNASALALANPNPSFSQAPRRLFSHARLGLFSQPLLANDLDRQ
eukprot:12329561-Prorocentrum_lima.AAC.1